MAGHRKKPHDVVFDIGESKVFLENCKSQLNQVGSSTTEFENLEKAPNKGRKYGKRRTASLLETNASEKPVARLKSKSTKEALVRFDVGASDNEDDQQKKGDILKERKGDSNAEEQTSEEEEMNEDGADHGDTIQAAPLLDRCNESFESTAKAIKPHNVYIELYDLHLAEGGEREWQETARWIKYEEDAEGVDHHWGRPHVAFLSFHALLQLRKCLADGVVTLDLDADSYNDVCEHITFELAEKFKMDEMRMKAIVNTLNKKHKHVHEGQQMPRVLTRLPSVLSKASHGANDSRRKQSMPNFSKLTSFAHNSAKRLSFMDAIAEASHEVSQTPSLTGSSVNMNGSFKPGQRSATHSGELDFVNEEDDTGIILQNMPLLHINLWL